jgi:hypothetical protein
VSGEYRLRAQFFALKRAVHYPAGRHPAGRGRSISPPSIFKPPPERVWILSDLDAARELARQIRLEYGDTVALTVEPVDPPAPLPRLRQQSFNWRE